jgi:hypothetical protein
MTINRRGIKLMIIILWKDLTLSNQLKGLLFKIVMIEKKIFNPTVNKTKTHSNREKEDHKKNWTIIFKINKTPTIIITHHYMTRMSLTQNMVTKFNISSHTRLKNSQVLIKQRSKALLKIVHNLITLNLITFRCISRITFKV